MQRTGKKASPLGFGKGVLKLLLIAVYAITSQDVRNCLAIQQIRYDCLFQYRIEREEAVS